MTIYRGKSLIQSVNYFGEVNDMTSEVLTAIFSLAGTLVGSLGGILAAGRLTAYRLQQLEEKVNKHNNLIERVYALERHDEVQDVKIERLESEVESNEN